MRVAIIIGIAKYDNCDDLDACKRDVEAMNELLLKAGSHSASNILKITGEGKANETKEKIITFLKSYKDQEILEVFFYFSGHGLYHEDELYYLMSDYKMSSTRQTTIENSEVDDWMRNLNPKIAIKVIDACYSGLNYIKNDQVIIKSLEKGRKRFENVYFFSSSQVDQTSYASKDLSDFTKSFLLAIKNCSFGKVRYKQIVDGISDHFETQGKQIPQFIAQATMTEVFCNLDSVLKKAIEDILDKHIPAPAAMVSDSVTAITTSQQTLKHMIEEDEKNCLTEDEAKDLFSRIKTQFESFTFPHELVELFDFRIEFKKIDYEYDTDIFPSPDVIGRWLNTSEHTYYAEPVWEEIEEPLSQYAIALNPFLRTRKKSEITDFKLSADLDYDFVKVSAMSKHLNVSDRELVIVFILSNRKMQVFYYWSSLIDKSWYDKVRPESIKWITLDWELKESDKILESLNSILTRFYESIKTQLEKQFLAESVEENKDKS